MKSNWVSLAVAFATMFLLTLVGVIFWFRPIAEADGAGTPLLSPALNLTAYSLVSVLLFAWTARRIGSPYAAAFVLAAAQILLVIDLTLRGDRGLATAGAGIVLILVTWAAVAFGSSLVARNGRS